MVVQHKRTSLVEYHGKAFALFEFVLCNAIVGYMVVVITKGNFTEAIIGVSNTKTIAARCMYEAGQHDIVLNGNVVRGVIAVAVCDYGLPSTI